MAELVLIRHGQTAWSRTGQHTGRSDIPLTPHGEHQAVAIGAALRGGPFGLVLVSPRERARSTAHLAGLAAAEVDPALAEWDYGAYEGRTTADIEDWLGRPWSLWTEGVPPGGTPGESLEQVTARVQLVLERVRPRLAAGEDVALVAHAHVLRVLTVRWLGLPAAAGSHFTLSAGSISRLGFEHGEPAMLSWNQVALPEERVLRQPGNRPRGVGIGMVPGAGTTFEPEEDPGGIG